jgi:type IV pilus assembly protein PilC
VPLEKNQAPLTTCYEAEVDDMVAGISSLMEPIIIVILGTVIGGIVVAMYLPIFKLGQVV